MKKWISTALGGAPVYDDDLLDIFNSEFWDVIQGLLSPYNIGSEGIIVTGCVVSGSGPYDISSGIVYLDGEFFRYAGETGLTLPRYIQQNLTQILDNRTFADSTIHTVALTKEAGSAPTAAVGIQNINVTTPSDPDERRLLNILIPADNLTTSAILQALSANQGGVLKGLIDALTLNKANKAQSAWSNLTLTNGWASVSGSTVQYRVDQFGKVNLRGQLDGTSSTGLVFTTSLPTSVKQNRISTLRSNASVIQASQFTVSTSGQGQSIFGSGDDIIFLDGISYWVD